MGYFNVKSLIFYGIAIGSVAILFKTVTAYGKNHLKAPPPVGGRYQLYAENFPPCLQKEPKILLVEQSGIYLHGLLLAESENLSPEVLAEEKPTLSGKWQTERLTLSGTAPLVGSCDRIYLEATQQAPNHLDGQIRFGTSTGAIPFTAEKEIAKPPSPRGH